MILVSSASQVGRKGNLLRSTTLSGLDEDARRVWPKLIKGTVDRTIRILSDPSLKGDGKKDLRHQLAREAILPRFDFNEMAKRSLGSYWRRLTAQEQQNFVSVFSQFLEKIYITRIDAFNGEKFIYTGEQVDQDYARVDSKVQIPTGKEFSISLRGN